jgi:cytoskeletal protein RodZ
MKSALAILAGLLVGVLVAAGVLAAFVFVGPDPVGLRPTPSPSAVPTQVVAASPSIAPSASPSIAPSLFPSVAPLAPPSTAPSGSAPGSGSPSPSEASQAA